MILLFGGTAETGEIAAALEREGFDILVSAATDFPLDIPVSSRITIRTGRLTESGMESLIRDMNIKVVIDATHPYATEVTATAHSASSTCRIPYYRYCRPSAIGKAPGVFFMKNHVEAAAKAFSFGTNVLLTTGSKNLLPYIQAARKSNARLVVRVLNTEDSIRSCIKAGIAKDLIIAGKGPFSVDDNIAAIIKYNIGVLVTKDGGTRGGVLEKLEASKAENCAIVVVKRPAEFHESTWSEIDQLVNAVKAGIHVR
jgi:precorrin-6A/cobalt-precorrin-6A reductase